MDEGNSHRDNRDHALIEWILRRKLDAKADRPELLERYRSHVEVEAGGRAEKDRLNDARPLKELSGMYAYWLEKKLRGRKTSGVGR